MGLISNKHRPAQPSYLTKMCMFRNLWDTPFRINMEPENDGLEDDFPFQLGDL